MFVFAIGEPKKHINIFIIILSNRRKYIVEMVAV